MKKILLLIASIALMGFQEAPQIDLITKSDSEERAPALSPDGAMLAYLRSSDNERDLELVIMDLTTRSQQVPLPGIAFNSPPVWKGDNESLIASAKQSDGGYKLVEINTRTREISTPLFTGPNIAEGDQLFPDIDRRTGRIAFSILMPPNLLASPRPNFDIYEGDPEEGTARAVITSEYRDMWPRFDRNGRGIYYFSRSASRGRHDDIYYYDFENEGTQRLTKSSGNDFVPARSPDGKSLVFASNRDGEPALYIMENNRTRRITPTGTRATHPVWSRDGNQIYFTIRRGDERGNIAVITLKMLHLLEQ